MEFCPKCGGMFVGKKEGDKMVLACHSCGYIATEKEVKGYKLVEKPREKDDDPLVLEDAPATKPKTRNKCPKCGHNEAYWWMSQTRGADEPTTRFYKCVKCEHTWREY